MPCSRCNVLNQYLTSIQPSTTIRQLDYLPHLRQLSISLQLDAYSTEFIVADDAGNKLLIKAAAQRRAVALFLCCGKAQHAPALETCIVRFQTIYPSSEHAYTVTPSKVLGEPAKVHESIVAAPLRRRDDFFDPWGGFF
jgi:hypothetical protein